MKLLGAMLRTGEGGGGASLFGLFAFVALAAPSIFPGDPLAIVANPLLPPFADTAHLLGSDRLGRDVQIGRAHV